MIHSIKCNQDSFKPVYFKSGFNVILAERTKESTKRDSRNGLGKSTLIEIIHFCLGSKKGETLSKSEMDDWEFTIEIDLAGKRYSVTRNTSNTNQIIVEGDCSEWEIKPSIDEKTRKQVFSSRDWNRCLGTLMFGLQTVYSDYKYVPTFRSLISYFIRRNGQSGAFLDPFQQYKNQKEWDKQVNNSFLLGLGWQFASKWQVLKDRTKVLDQIKNEAKSGILSNLLGSTGELEALKIRLHSQVEQEKEQLDNFKVHPQYSKLENDANNITKLIHEYVNSNINDKRFLEHYEASLEQEADAKPESVTKVYEEAGLILPDSINKKIEDVMSFHKQVVSNRKGFLSSEIERIKKDILKREEEIKTLTDKRVELMKTLKEHGALKEYTQLQNNHQETVSQLKDVGLKLENLKKFEEGKSAVSVEEELLRQKAKNDMNERAVQKENAILTFNENSKYLYKAPGILSID
ncbi:MAG: DUF2326 domain-containing protein, partial [Candidatus Lokiarchaeota archaeon]|nr:DUF2326 domain-containing protein [Candidatus Lokiarchaeota archaeon]